MKLGEQLKQHRTNLGLSIREMSQMIGITPTWLSRLENHHENTMSDDTARRVAYVLGIDAREIFRALGRFPKDTMQILAQNKELFHQTWTETERGKEVGF